MIVEKFRDYQIDRIKYALLNGRSSIVLIHSEFGAGKTYLIKNVIQEINTESDTLKCEYFPFPENHNIVEEMCSIINRNFILDFNDKEDIKDIQKMTSQQEYDKTKYLNSSVLWAPFMYGTLGAGAITLIIEGLKQILDPTLSIYLGAALLIFGIVLVVVFGLYFFYMRRQTMKNMSRPHTFHEQISQFTPKVGEYMKQNKSRYKHYTVVIDNFDNIEENQQIDILKTLKLIADADDNPFNFVLLKSEHEKTPSITKFNSLIRANYVDYELLIRYNSKRAAAIALNKINRTLKEYNLLDVSFNSNPKLAEDVRKQIHNIAKLCTTYLQMNNIAFIVSQYIFEAKAIVNEVNINEIIAIVTLRELYPILAKSIIKGAKITTNVSQLSIAAQKLFATKERELTNIGINGLILNRPETVDYLSLIDDIKVWRAPFLVEGGTAYLEIEDQEE